MFASLQLGKGLERQNQNIRRLIYGYNAVMTGLLLLAVLTLVNVLAYAEPFTRFFGRPFDWTETATSTPCRRRRATCWPTSRSRSRSISLLPAGDAHRGRHPDAAGQLQDPDAEVHLGARSRRSRRTRTRSRS